MGFDIFSRSGNFHNGGESVVGRGEVIFFGSVKKAIGVYYQNFQIFAWRGGAGAAELDIVAGYTLKY